jgi:transcriptional regulator with XRE-family HTH domain
VCHGACRMGCFSDKLRSEIARQNISIRALARRIDPDDIERGRRNIHRWLADSPVTPSPASRRAVEEALGLPVEALEDDEDEEAADMELARDLLLFLRRAIVVEQHA